MNPPSFPILIQRFFADYLTRQRNLSTHTVRSYRHAFRLLLSFAASRAKTPIDRLSFTHFTPEIVLGFLDHLEHARTNAIRSRNTRLAAIRCFARYCLSQAAPDQIGSCQRILSLPAKRCERPVLGFMTREEIDALLHAIAQNTRSDRRDFLFFSLLYNTGARVSEMLQLRPIDVQTHAVLLHGKGRKERIVPIWRSTERSLKNWIKTMRIGAEQSIFTNYRGETLTRDGIAHRLALHVKSAAKNCPSLRERRISPHTFRHTAAMHLLQSGVALEVIALWLGHERPITTHGYIEADLKMKAQCMAHLDQPRQHRSRSEGGDSRLLAFLEAL